MKKNIFFIAFALVSFICSVNAQNCHNSTVKKDKACCAKKADKSTTPGMDTDAKAVFVSTKVHNETKKFIVYGNCGMCEKTIEGALKDVKGILAADWNIDTDEMIVTFNPHVINLDDIKQKIADVGYDTDTHRAKDEVYNSLPGCCQYERPKN